MDLLDQLLKVTKDASMDFNSIVEDFMMEDAVDSAELKAKHAAETEKLKDSQERDLESLTTRHEREVARQSDSDSKEKDDDAIKSKRDADRKSNEKQSEGLLNFIDTWKQELDEVSASKRLTTRLKKSGVDLDKRAKDRAKEHAALVKKYGKKNESFDLDEGKLVASVRDILKVITRKIETKLDQEYTKNPERGLGMINTLGAMVGHKVTDEKQDKGKMFLKFGEETVTEDRELDALKRKFKRDIKKYENDGYFKNEKASQAFMDYALDNGEIKTDDPDEFEDWMDRDVLESLGEKKVECPHCDGKGYHITEEFTEDTHPCKGLSEDDPCWKDYKQVGMKKKNGKEVPNCVPKEEVELDEALSPKDKKVIDAFYDGKDMDGKTVKSVGDKLETTGMGAQVVLKRQGNKFRIFGVIDSRRVQEIIRYIKKSYPKNTVIESEENEVEEDRDYKKERENYGGRPEQMERNAARKRARRQMEKEGKAKAGDGKDVHHKDNNPLNNDKNNLSLVSQNYNRKEPRLRMKKLKEKGALPNVRK